MIHARTWAAFLPVLGWVGCASTPMPAEHLASAEAGIRGATEVGAESVPQAALHLKMANDQVAQAKGLLQNGDEERAKLVLERAESDAELSLTLAREASARSEANAVMEQIQTLRKLTP